MANTACTVKRISLITIQNGGKYEGGIDNDGNELSDVQIVASFEPDKRVYHCSNCNRDFNGSDTFDEVKKHLGTFPVD